MSVASINARIQGGAENDGGPWPAVIELGILKSISIIVPVRNYCRNRQFDKRVDLVKTVNACDRGHRLLQASVCRRLENDKMIFNFLRSRQAPISYLV